MKQYIFLCAVSTGEQFSADLKGLLKLLAFGKIHNCPSYILTKYSSMGIQAARPRRERRDRIISIDPRRIG